MRKYNCDNYRNVAILGSFGKHYDLIVEVSRIFIENGYNVLVPKMCGIKVDSGDFLLLVGDDSNDPRQIEKDFLNKCLEADFVYVCDKDGYVGTTVAFELGVLTSYGQEIFFMEKPKDPLFGSMINQDESAVCSPEDLITHLSIHDEVISWREWFDNYHDDDRVPFSLSKKKNTSINPKVIGE